MDSSKLKFSRMVRVITELPHPSPESNCNSFLKKLLMMGEFSTLNILELTCKWNSCFKRSEVVLPLQIEHQLAREHNIRAVSRRIFSKIRAKIQAKPKFWDVIDLFVI